MQLRSPVTVIVTIDAVWQNTRTCLEALKPTLGVRDQVIAICPEQPAGYGPDVVDSAQLREFGWLETISIPEGTTLDAARTQAASSARHGIVAFLDSDTLPTAFWLDSLAAPLADETVTAVGPRTTHALGSQCVQVPHDNNTGPAGLRRFAREWRYAHRHELTETTFLTGVAVAMRRDDVRATGSVTAVMSAGKRLVAHEVFVPHFATDSCTISDFDTAHRPLISANLIVKNEEDVLADCLASLTGLVDEIVVYDTGSTDSTMDVARQAGATVIEGYWDDHFGDARNRSLDHCAGHWALWIDADEKATGDFAAIRARLAAANVEGFLVPIENLTSGGIGPTSTFSAMRLFRPDLTRYAGRLHEQVLRREDGRGALSDRLPELTLIHSGYLAARVAERDKSSRNLRLAELAVSADEADGAVDQAMALCNLARSQCATGQFDDALASCERAATFTDNPRNLRTVLQTATEVQLSAGRAGEARLWLDRLREASETPHTADRLEAKILLAEGKSAEALELIERLPDSFIDEDAKEVRRDSMTALEANALVGAGRTDEAVELLLDRIRAGVSNIHLVALLAIMRDAGVGAVALAEALPDALWTPFLAQVLQAPPSVGDEMLDAMWRYRGSERGVLAAAVKLGPRLPVLRALEWSARLRAAGLDQACPLAALATDLSRTPRDRVLASAVAAELYSDSRAMNALSEALAEVSDDDAAAVLEEVRMLAPSVAELLELAPTA